MKHAKMFGKSFLARLSYSEIMNTCKNQREPRVLLKTDDVVVSMISDF